MPPDAGAGSAQEANMSRRQPKLLATTVVLSLLLAALPAAAQGRAGARPSVTQASGWLEVTWSFLTSLWSGAPAPRGVVSIRGAEGGSLDPDGKPHATTTATTQVPPSDEGVSLDPHG
jgi:hypothetical protein